MKINDWAVLIYSSGSRDLEPATRAALEEVAQSPLADRVVVGAQLGTADETLRLSLPLNQREQLAPVDMSSPDTLKDFLKWGMEKFPARHYAVVLGGHSSGFAGACTNAERSKMMRLPELADAVGTAKPDLVIFNSCLMAQAEVATELAPVADHLVASQTEIRGLGMPLGEWLTTLQGTPVQAAQQLQKACAKAGDRAEHVSALDLKQPVTEPLDAVAAQILANPQDKAALNAGIAAEPSFWHRPQDRPLTDMKDIRGLLARWEGDARLSPSLRETCRDALTRIPPGLSVYAGSLPFVEPIYDQLQMARTTHWEEAMRSL